MKIRHLHQPSGITDGIPFLIESHWTPDQALAVVELLDDLREQIWRHYELQLHALYRADRVQENAAVRCTANSDIDTEPF